jgi:hypothetical protein
MHRTWNSTKVLGLSLLAVLGVMAVTAVAAQAGEFRVNKSTFAASGITSETFGGKVGESTFSVAWLGFEIKCASAALSGTASKGGSASVQANFVGCAVVGNKFCKIYPTKTDMEVKTNAGEIRISGQGEILLHGGNHYVKFPQQTFTTLYIGSPKAGCTLQQEMEAAGSAAVKLPSALSELVEQPFAAVAGKVESALLEVSVRCAGEPAEILGSEGSLSLSGANKGKTWGLE